MRVDGEEVVARGIAAGDDEVCADVALVAEEMLLQHRHDGDDTRFAARGEGVQFEVGADQGRREFGVCGGTGACAPDLGSDVMELLAVLSSPTLVIGRELALAVQRFHTLSATMGPLVARVSAAMTTPPS